MRNLLRTRLMSAADERFPQTMTNREVALNLLRELAEQA